MNLASELLVQPQMYWHSRINSDMQFHPFNNIAKKYRGISDECPFEVMHIKKKLWICGVIQKNLKPDIVLSAAKGRRAQMSQLNKIKRNILEVKQNPSLWPVVSLTGQDLVQNVTTKQNKMHKS